LILERHKVSDDALLAHMCLREEGFVVFVSKNTRNLSNL